MLQYRTLLFITTYMQTEARHAAINKKLFTISCIVPVYNEEGLVGSFFPQLATALKNLTHQFEIIVVDDGSLDRTVQELEKLPKDCHIKMIALSRNFGKEIALTAGLEHCAGDLAIIMDADFQHPIETISEFIKYWGEGYDMVYGVRNSRKNESALKRHFSNLFYWTMTKITKIDLPQNAGDFRLLDRKVINALNSFKERTRFMKGLYAWVGFKKIGVPFDVQERAGGKSSWGFKRLTELAITGITSFSDVPLRVWGLIGFVVSVIALIYAIFFLTYTLIYGPDSPGFPSIIIALLFFGGIQLLSIGILGEYIARIFTEVKQRPTYIIEKKYGFEE